MVLADAPSRLFARRSSEWPIPDLLFGLSPSDEIADAGHLLIHERFANRTSLSMCHACDMEQPTRDDTRLESLVFTSIFCIGPFRAGAGKLLVKKPANSLS
jgi:hypothetical protein